MIYFTARAEDFSEVKQMRPTLRTTTLLPEASLTARPFGLWMHPTAKISSIVELKTRKQSRAIFTSFPELEPATCVTMANLYSVRTALLSRPSSVKRVDCSNLIPLPCRELHRSSLAAGADGNYQNGLRPNSAKASSVNFAQFIRYRSVRSGHLSPCGIAICAFDGCLDTGYSFGCHRELISHSHPGLCASFDICLASLPDEGAYEDSLGIKNLNSHNRTRDVGAVLVADKSSNKRPRAVWGSLDLISAFNDVNQPTTLCVGPHFRAADAFALGFVQPNSNNDCNEDCQHKRKNHGNVSGVPLIRPPTLI